MNNTYEGAINWSVNLYENHLNKLTIFHFRKTRFPLNRTFTVYVLKLKFKKIQ